MTHPESEQYSQRRLEQRDITRHVLIRIGSHDLPIAIASTFVWSWVLGATDWRVLTVLTLLRAAVWKVSGNPYRGTIVAGWAGRAVAVLALALGIDYALFIVHRFRGSLVGGSQRSVADAVAVTMDTAGKAVLFSGVTVLVSLSAVLLVPSPAFRSMTLGIMLSVVFVLAATLTLLPAFKAADFLALAVRERMTHTVLVPAMYNLCLLEPDFERCDLSGWRIGGYGGAPMPPATIARFAEKLPGLGLMNLYGATETTSPATMMPPQETARHSDSVGRVVPCGEIRVVDEREEARVGALAFQMLSQIDAVQLLGEDVGGRRALVSEPRAAHGQSAVDGADRAPHAVADLGPFERWAGRASQTCPFGAGFRPADQRSRASAAARPQAARIHLHRVIARLRRLHGAAGDDLFQALVVGHRPAHRQRRRRSVDARRDARPQHDAIGERVAAGDAVQERPRRIAAQPCSVQLPALRAGGRNQRRPRHRRAQRAADELPARVTHHARS